MVESGRCGRKGGADMASKAEPKIAKVLGHLAWLETQAGPRITRDEVYNVTLLVWAAAARLQVHFVMPLHSADQIANESKRKEAAKLIDDFLHTARALFKDVEAASHVGQIDERTIEKVRSALPNLLANFLGDLPRLFNLNSPAPARWQELERDPDWSKLLREWIDNHPLRGSMPRSSGRKTGRLAGLRQALAGVLAVKQGSDAMKTAPADVRRAVRETVAGFVEFAAEEAADECEGDAKTRWLDLGKGISQNLRAVDGKNG